MSDTETLSDLATTREGSGEIAHTEEEKATLRRWFCKAKWFVVLRRAGHA